MHAFEEVLAFWFDELEPAQWWIKDPSLDGEITRRFLEVHRCAAAGELEGWRGAPSGRLAEVIVLDQFSRNMFRDTPQAWAFDAMALDRAREAIEVGADVSLAPERRGFLYMPFMHSESALDHEEAVRLFEALGNPNSVDYEHRHKAIIDRFGRYPHRNAVLGRTSTPQEVAFLKEPGSSF